MRNEKGAVDLMPSIGKQFASVLAFVHSLRIVHRDIKPRNVLVDRRPLAATGVTVVLADFGAACRVEYSLTGQKRQLKNLWGLIPISSSRSV